MKCNTYYGDHIIYDDMNKAIQTEDITFYNKYLKNNMRALEVACGTGRLSKEIYEHVNEYIGLDYSTDMLEIAKTKNRNVQYIWGDMRNLEKEKLGMFDIIICGFNSLQHLKNDEDIDNFLKSCDNVLRNKGLLIIDIFNPDMRFLNIKEIKEYRYSFYSEYYKDNIDLYEIRKYDKTTRINYLTNIYVNEKLNVNIESNTFMRQYFPGQLEELINKSNFSIKEKIGDYNYNEFNLQSPKQIFILQKSDGK